MKKITFIILSFALISLTSCDVNKFLEDVATALEESSQDPNSGGSTGNSGGSTQPESKPRTTERAGSVEDPIFSQLGLSQAQTTQFNTIDKKYKDKISASQNSGKDRITISKEVKALRTKRESELMAILNTSQKQKYDELLAKEKGR